MSFLLNINIARKIIIGFSLLILIVGSTLGYIYSRLNFIDSNMDWTIHTYNVLGTLNDALMAMVNQETGVRGYLVSDNDKNFLEPYYQGRTQYEEAFTKVKNLTSDNPKVQGMLDEMDVLANNWYNDIAKKEIALMEDPSTMAEARAMEASGAGKASMDGFRTKLAEIANIEGGLLITREAEKNVAVASANQAIIAGTITSIIISILVGFALSRSIAKPIVNMTRQMKELADGNFAIEVSGQERGDELGIMAKIVFYFQQVLIKNKEMAATEQKLTQIKLDRQQKVDELLSDFESDVKSMVNTVASAATELAQTAGSMVITAKESTQKSSNACGEAANTTANVQSVAAASEELAATVQEISSQLQKTSTLVYESQEKAKNADDMATALNEATHKVGTAMEMIANIAGQINLLALNATIESARAGDAGKGFAVVASEVKNLANQTNKTTEEIKQIVEGMRNAAQDIIGALKQIGVSVSSISSATLSVASVVEKQSTTTSEISRNMQTAASSTQSIADSLQGVQEASSMAGSASEQMLMASQELSKQAEELNMQVDNFLRGIRAA